MSELEIAEHYDRMNKVVEELLKGNNATQISKELSAIWSLRKLQQ